MKATPKEMKITQRMQPGAITLNGFLGSDTRPLNEIISDDEAALNRLGHTKEDIAAKMEYLTQKSWGSYEDEILIDGKYLVETEVFRGKLPCPFSHIGIYRKAITKLFNQNNGVRVTWTSLNIHLIKEHGFFEGKESVFRLDPETLIKALFD